MKHFPLVWAGLWRKPARTIFTFLSIIIAFVLFGILMGLNGAFDAMIDRARLDRVFVGGRFGPLIPLAHVEQIARMDGVKVVSHNAGWFGHYQDPKNPAFILGVGDNYLRVMPEVRVTPEQFAAMRRLRSGIIISEKMSTRMGWKAGQRINIETPAPPMTRKDGAAFWSFDIVAVVPDAFETNNGMAIGNFEYLEEGRARNQGTAVFLQLLVDDPAHGDAIANAIDRRFANSDAPTRSAVEKDALVAGLQGALDIKFMTYTVVGAALFMLLFLTGNVMAQSVRERLAEFAVLKTLGYSDRGVTALVVAEAAIPCVIGAVVGVTAASAISTVAAGFMPGGPNVPLPEVSPTVGLYALAAAVLVAIVSTLPAAHRLARLSLANALSGR